MSKLILLTAIAAGTLVAQNYSVQSCEPGRLCTTSQVTVTPQVTTDPRIILGGTNINDVVSRNLYRLREQELMRQQIEINRRILQQLRAQQQNPRP